MMTVFCMHIVKYPIKCDRYICLLIKCRYIVMTSIKSTFNVSPLEDSTRNSVTSLHVLLPKVEIAKMWHHEKWLQLLGTLLSTLQSGTQRWHLGVPDLGMCCSDLTSRYCTITIVPVMAIMVTCPIKVIVCSLCVHVQDVLGIAAV